MKPVYDYFFGNSSMIPNFALFLEQSINPHKGSTLRVPFYLTSSYRRNMKLKGVALQVNPSSVSFRQDKRVSERDTQEGKVFFHWTNAMGHNDDVIRMEFNGQTGNIGLRTGTRGSGFLGTLPFSASKGAGWVAEKMQSISGTNPEENPGALRVWGANEDTSGASKLANLHNLWSLTREPVLDVAFGAPINYYITYVSPLFGNSLVTFIGHFSRPLEITDDANDPFNRRYSFGFVAHGSYPPPSFLYSTVLQNLSQTFMNPLAS